MNLRKITAVVSVGCVAVMAGCSPNDESPAPGSETEGLPETSAPGTGGAGTGGAGTGGAGTGGTGAGGVDALGGNGGSTSLDDATLDELLALVCERDRTCAVDGGDAWEFASISECSGAFMWENSSPDCDAALADNLRCHLEAGSCQLDPSDGNAYQYFGLPDDALTCESESFAEETACETP